MSLRGHHKAITTGEGTISFLVVRFGVTALALPADGVRGVFTLNEAGTGESINAMGITYNYIDVAGLLSISASFDSIETRVVLYSTGQSHGAVKVDQVFGLAEVEPGQCMPLPAHFRNEERSWFRGMIFYQAGLALIVNPSWLLGEMAEVVPGAVGGFESQSTLRMAAGRASC